MKRGISLIVLVITIIVMIILAATIIISISNSNVINKANEAVLGTNIQNVKDAASLKYADATMAVTSPLLSWQRMGEYIEQELIKDNVIEADNPYFFTDTGGAIYVPGYSEEDADASKYRVIGNTVYYLGTDVDRRLELKDVSGVSIEYILIDTEYSKSGANYTVASVGMQGKITSYTEITLGDIDGNSALDIDNIKLVTGTRLYSNSQEIGQVLIVGDIYPNGVVNSEEIASILFNIIGTTSYRGTIEGDIGTEEGYFSEAEIKKFNFEIIYILIADVNLNGAVEMCDIHILWAYAFDALFGKKLTQIVTPENPDYEDITSGLYDVNKIITKLPVDLRNKN